MKMSQELIAGKRYPRGMRRIMKDKGKKRSFSYYDLGKDLRNSSLEEYNNYVAEIKKKGNFC
jgi:hypothetical protein